MRTAKCQSEEDVFDLGRGHARAGVPHPLSKALDPDRAAAGAELRGVHEDLDDVGIVERGKDLGAELRSELSGAALAPFGAVPLEPGGWLGALLLSILFAAGAEGLFRGLVYGLLLFPFRQTTGGRFRLSAPLLLSSLFFALATLIPVWPFARDSIEVTVAAAFGLGLVCGVARDRSESLLPPTLLHVAAALVPATVATLVS